MSQYSLISAFSIGAIYAVVSLGLYISFRVLRFADLTADGSYSLGACITAVLVLHGVSPGWTIFAASSAGFIAGFCTGMMHSRFGFPQVICGIIMMTAAYSINATAMRAPNLSIPLEDSVFGSIELWIRDSPTLALASQRTVVYPVLLATFALSLYLIAWRFFVSQIGLQWRCAGISAELAERNSISVKRVIPIGIGIGNAIIGLGGGMTAHFQRFSDVNMGVGILMVGLAAVFMGQAGESLLGEHRANHTVGVQLSCLFVATFVYRLLIALAYEIGLPASLFHLTTAILVFIALLVPNFRPARGWKFPRS